jgi:hypothetical protein
MRIVVVRVFEEEGLGVVGRIANSGCADCGTRDIGYPGPTTIVAQLFPATIAVKELRKQRESVQISL